MWQADLEDGTYKNPIIHADYSDPDVICVGDDFFMTASSFTYSPGLPILHSKDLVNWKVVNYAIERMPYEKYDLPRHGEGVWAPALRYHNGEYYIYFGAPDEGIFMVKTKDPFGKWEEPVLVKKACGWIDTCPFWDEDGSAYLVHAFAGSRAGIKSVLHINKMSPDGKSLLDEGVLVIDGRENNPTLEGPKMYKRNGYYYIFAPAGGVESGWQSIFRSKNIYGPYEERVVLAQGNTPVNGPHQGGWVELENKESWFIHFQDVEAYGRIVHLQPVEWVDDWPVMGEPIEDVSGLKDDDYLLSSKYDFKKLVPRKHLGQPVMRYKKPNVGKEYPVTVPDTTDEFQGVSLGKQWQWQANYKEEWYSLTEKPNYLRLYTANTVCDKVNNLYELPNLLTQMFQMPTFEVVTKVEHSPDKISDECGLIITGEEYQYIALINSPEGTFVEHRKGIGNKEGADEKVTEKVNVGSTNIYFKVEVRMLEGQNDKAIGRFYYSYDGQCFYEIGETFTPVPGKWVGAKVGIYATNFNTSDSLGYADFDWVRVNEL